MRNRVDQAALIIAPGGPAQNGRLNVSFGAGKIAGLIFATARAAVASARPLHGPPGQAQSNLVIVPTGELADFYNGSNGNLDVVADLEGYFTQ